MPFERVPTDIRACSILESGHIGRKITLFRVAFAVYGLQIVCVTEGKVHEQRAIAEQLIGCDYGWRVCGVRLSPGNARFKNLKNL